MSSSKTNPVPQRVISRLIASALQDPQLPRQSPTEAFWQVPVSNISRQQSSKLPSSTTYAIIGSGVTGCSVAKNLLENLPSESKATVTVFEARALTSGATGRNGGHLLSPLPEEFTLMEKHYGTEETIKMARFANRTLDKMHGLAENADPELRKAAEVRKVRTVTGYRSKELFEEAKASQKRYEECLPEFKGDHEAIHGEEAVEKYNMKGNAGVIVNSAGAFWPYRLITGLLERLLQRYKGRFTVETETPVTSVQHDDNGNAEHPYILTTPRGTIRASKVIYCSNGWTGHLLPKLRGKIFPLRGTMSTQQAGPELPHEGDQQSWSVLDKPTYDVKDDTFSYGLYYITQNATTGDVFIGGEKQKVDEMLSSDDSTISQVSKETLEGILPSIFEKGWPVNEKPHVRKLWSGIMGFTPDHIPWVGQIPSSVTGRKGDGEYIAAGFNGYGMPLCWGCGEAVAKMVLGKEEEVDVWLPSSFLITPKRLASPYSTVEAAIVGLLEGQLGLASKAYLAWSFATSYARRTIFG
ncbi:hypothetical protein M409DRAFT_23011 [Zasmidium cellare ATCC 36951]|uniref:FAD dependent oxidoreductase domain-containing protein n=1 Tax=Zasmidium cellare ATCC 36951 TaxID=1080233 RepID=A0A6A6CND0_ZASCE|nr:uncharacterized protein M409DRAFT_23011 [Zasmidium cellare ATCC 36951]KAF2166966.1 hypothetical protein M409DRAFT_23011 [Zasmidium cellare ATCC 36951]